MATDALCAVCYCEVEETDAVILCSEGHAIHVDECFAQLMRNTTKEHQNFFKDHNSLKCMQGQCTGHYDEQHIISTGNYELIRTYFKVIRDLDVAIQLESAIANPVADAENKVEFIKKEFHNILNCTFKCPRCNVPFADFTGCLALYCEHCGCGFCALCLKEAPHRDAHDHVASHTRLDIIQNDTGKTKSLSHDFGVFSEFYMPSQNWDKYRTFVLIGKIVNYLTKNKSDLLWDAWKEFKNDIRHAWSAHDINEIDEMICSGGVQFVKKFHITRLPDIYYNLLASYKDEDVEQIRLHYPLTEYERISLGKFVVESVRSEFPSWDSTKSKVGVPGKHFSAIAYPPEMLRTVTRTIIAWGIRVGKWDATM